MYQEDLIWAGFPLHAFGVCFVRRAFRMALQTVRCLLRRNWIDEFLVLSVPTAVPAPALSYKTGILVRETVCSTHRTDDLVDRLPLDDLDPSGQIDS